MNFSAVRIIRRGRRNGESGQAFAELTVSLIAIMAAFAGFLLVAVLSSDGVSISIEARRRADELSSNGYYSNALTISRWDHAEDTSSYMTDEQDPSRYGGNGPLFRDQLRDPSRKVSFIGSSELRYDNEFDGLQQDTDFFLGAADLSDGRASTSNSLKDHGIGSLDSVVRGLFRIDDVEIRDIVYMPAHKDTPDY